ncbi:hypothetical protein ABNQ39_20435 [Azospirillum sp. A26]|uniref:hypothetical protein n=1 Tax=Azospirillum sp. A26 TaxID=3160607 RepID=UPI00366C4C07
MTKLELTDFAVTALEHAPIDGLVVAAGWVGDLTKATVGVVKRHTPGGRIVLEDGTQFARSGNLYKMYGGDAFTRLYRGDPALVQAVKAAKDAERKARDARVTFYNIHDKTLRMGHAAKAEDYAAAKALDAIISAWPLTEEEASRLVELAKAIEAARLPSATDTDTQEEGHGADR